MTRLLLLTSLSLAGSLFIPSQSQAQINIGDEFLDGVNGSRIEIRSVFDPMPPSGYAPLRIVATNGSDHDQSWGFEFSSQTQEYRRNNKASSSLNLPVPARSTRSLTHLALVAVDYGESGYSRSGQTFTVAFSGPTFHSFNHYGNGVTDFPAIAISKNLADGSMDGLSDEVGERQKAKHSYWGGNNTFASRFQMEDAPEDWLGYSGFDYVMLTDADWQKLRPGSRNALMQWVRMGGRLHFYTTTGAPTGTPETDLQHSLGRIESFVWDGRKLNAESTVARYWEGRVRMKALVNEHDSPSWTLLSALGERQFGSWQVVAFLVLFGVLVGPVNLFVLAPSGRRHRLFITTPLLSLGASVMMVGLILIQDGIGGQGARFAFINLEPSETSAYVTQKQTSRTGVLLGAGFELATGSLIEPLALPDTPWVKLKNRSDSQPTNLTQNGSSRGGNFFQSRAEQAQMIRTAVSTRARLEVQPPATPGEAPSVVSALGFTVEEMFFVASDGSLWKNQSPLATGQKASLAKAEMKELRSWWDENRKASEMAALKDLISHPQNHFFAKAKHAPDFVQDTLSSIRWHEDAILVYGSITPP